MTITMNSEPISEVPRSNTSEQGSTPKPYATKRTKHKTSCGTRKMGKLDPLWRSRTL